MYVNSLAAHCFADATTNQPRSFSEFYITVGKKSRHKNVARSQIHNVSRNGRERSMSFLFVRDHVFEEYLRGSITRVKHFALTSATRNLYVDKRLFLLLYWYVVYVLYGEYFSATFYINWRTWYFTLCYSKRPKLELRIGVLWIIQGSETWRKLFGLAAGAG